ncbi:MAG: LamG domain-containing protein, partial [Verrucomicrobiaceae bacterium]
TVLGASSHASFGKAATIGSAAYGLGLDANGSGGFQPGNTTTTPALPDGIAHSSLTGTNGSFTLEALVNLPGLAGKREIISTDSTQTNRAFQFYTDVDGAVKFNFIATGAGTSASADIPSTGPHAFVANEWFHVAYVHDGATGTSLFYWTRLASTSTVANALATTGTEPGTGTVTGPLVIGNEARGPSGEGLLGLIDEIRISRTARAATAFLFSNDDTDTDGLSDAWERHHFENLDETGTDDPDHDGYDNEAEETAGTDPEDAASNPGDLDADGLPDVWEIAIFGNTAAQSADGDPDGDFSLNLLEFTHGTDPVDPLVWPDTDNDRMNDGWELLHFTGLGHDGSADSDLDGSTDKQEHDANSDPNEPAWSATRAALDHRWNFNGSLNDSVGGVTATIVDPDANPAAGGTGALTSTEVVLGGGARATSAYLQLGPGGLLAGRKTPVTIELWATQTAVQNWARIFDFGSGATEYLFMSWTRGTTLGQDQVRWLDSSNMQADDKGAPYTTGVPWHIVMTLEPCAGAGGTTRVSWHAARSDSPLLGGARWSFDTRNTMLFLNDTLNLLGRSQYPADNTASAKYDE